MIQIDLSSLFTKSAKIDNLSDYISQVLKAAGSGNDITLTGSAPVWLYLSAAHALHGKTKRLIYNSPVTGDIVIFDHDPF